MEQDKVENKKLSSIRSVIIESKEIRVQRGEDFYSNKKEAVAINPTSKKLTAEIQIPSINKDAENSKVNSKSLRESHLKLTQYISDNDKKIFDKNTQVFNTKKPRSKSIHLYLNAEIEHFLKAESKKSESHWGLRKNAGFGNLIQKFLENFIELKKREDRQLKRVRKVIDDFRTTLVEFKKHSLIPDEYLQTEEVNQKMKSLSNDLRILLSLLEFEDDSLKKCLGSDSLAWIDFIVRWKFHS